MVEIRTLPGGRYEVFAEGRHHEAFEGTLGAIVVAEGLAAALAAEAKQDVEIASPWGRKTVHAPGA